MFKIAATDRTTNATLYGRVVSGTVAFRTGVSYGGTSRDRTLGLHLDPACGTPLEITEAGALLERTAQELGMASWVSDLRIVLA